MTCPSCDQHDSIFLLNGVPKCAICKQTFGEYRATENAQRFEPIVYHKDAGGNIRLPASTVAPVPEGFQRFEARTMAEATMLERQVNAAEMRKYDRKESRDQFLGEQRSRERRASLAQDMQHMSNFGRDFARLAIDRSNARVKGRFDPGFHIEALHYDASSREQYSDKANGWKGRKG